MNPIITLSKKAIEKCKLIIRDNNAKALKLSLNSGGCNGFEYKFSVTNNVCKKGDDKIVIDNLEIIICGKSLLYLIGTNIDWKSDLMGETFHFENPNAQAVCGCGTSFNPKE